MKNRPTGDAAQVCSLDATHSAGPRHPRPASGEKRAPGEAGAGDVIAQRYELLTRLGRGGFGEVWRALDRVTLEQVAVKLLWRTSESAAEAFRRETALLRVLRLPGLVNLLDDGTHNHGLFLVTELVEGAPFPGEDGPVEWESVESATLSLLETLDLMHHAGVVHRDLKPGNVLVTSGGQPVVLDLGLALALAIDRGDGDLVGTPAYLAPEQASGRACDARADVYAVGVMLYEALSGRMPHEQLSMGDLLRAKISERPLPLAERAPDVPHYVCAAVDQMLDPRPAQRPGSARAAAELLHNQRRVFSLPWAGSRDAIDTAVAALEGGQHVAIDGPPASGRSRLMREIAIALVQRGVPVWRTAPQRGGLRLVWWSTVEQERTGAHPVASTLSSADKLARAIPAGSVICVDDADLLGRDAQIALDELGHSAALLVVGKRAASIRVEAPPLVESDLRNWFHGPDIGLRLQSDSAAEVWAQARGQVGSALRVLDRWVRTGRFWMDGDRLRTTRDALDRLRASSHVWLVGDGHSAVAPEELELLKWTQTAGTNLDAPRLATLTGLDTEVVDKAMRSLSEKGMRVGLPGGRAGVGVADDSRTSQRVRRHAALARELTPGSPGRLEHVVRGGLDGEVGQEALLESERLRGLGEHARAWLVCTLGLRAARQGERFVEEIALLREAVKVALEQQTRRPLDLVTWELRCTTRPRDARVEALVLLVDAARLARYDDRTGSRHGDSLQRMLPFLDPELEAQRHATTLRGARSARAHAEALAEAQGWARSCGSAEMAARVKGWEGLHAYRNGAYAAAAQCHREAIAGTQMVHAKLAAMSNLGAALLESGDLDEAESVGRDLERLACAGRNAFMEIQGLWLVMAANYRRRAWTPPDPELLRAVQDVDVPALRARVSLTSSAHAWRLGDNMLAQALALASAREFERLGQRGPSILAFALATAAGWRDQGMVARALRAVGERIPSVFGSQARALLAYGRAMRKSQRARARLDATLASETVCGHDVLSDDEISALLAE